MISSAYTYYMSQYGHSVNAKYDSHSKSQLKNSFNKVLKSNSQSPTYKVDFSLAAQKYAIDLKEHARQLSYVVRDLSDEKTDELTFKKSARSDNPEAISATYIGDSSATDIPSVEISVSQIAGRQINTGNFLVPDRKNIKEGTYSFDLNINNLTYEFEFNVSDSETNIDIQNKISRLINRSNVGLSSMIIKDSSSNTAIQLTSDNTGTGTTRPVLFDIETPDSRLSDVLGLEQITEYPANAVFTINGEERTSPTNNFTLNKNFNITLLAPTNDTPATISMKDDAGSIVESIEDLVSGYNKIVSLTTKGENTSFEGNKKLLREFSGIAAAHRSTLSNTGLNIENDGSISVNEDVILEAAQNGNIRSIFSELNDFKKNMQHKAESIATNPMNYVNNKIIAYKNPTRTLNDPYNLSAYTGMMFNSYI